jgi:hypothetical protein
MERRDAPKVEYDEASEAPQSHPRLDCFEPSLFEGQLFFTASDFVCRTEIARPRSPCVAALHDMDSSSDDEGDYTTTSVTLGYAAPDASGDEISHLGGYSVSTRSITQEEACLTRADLVGRETEATCNTRKMQSMQRLHLAASAT